MQVSSLTSHEAEFDLSYAEVLIFIEAIEEACKEIEDWEFQTLLGFYRQDAIKLLKKLKEFKDSSGKSDGSKAMGEHKTI